MPDFIMVRIPRELAARVDDTRHASVSREAWVREVVTREVDRADSNRRALGAAVHQQAVEAFAPPPSPQASAPEVDRAIEAKAKTSSLCKTHDAPITRVGGRCHRAGCMG